MMSTRRNGCQAPASRWNRYGSGYGSTDGVPVPNVFPQVYALDPSGTTLSGLPVAPNQCAAAVPAPKVTVPKLLTP